MMSTTIISSAIEGEMKAEGEFLISSATWVFTGCLLSESCRKFQKAESMALR